MRFVVVACSPYCCGVLSLVNATGMLAVALSMGISVGVDLGYSAVILPLRGECASVCIPLEFRPRGSTARSWWVLFQKSFKGPSEPIVGYMDLK